MKIDPAELRRRNLLGPEQMPYTNPMGQVYDSGAFEKILDQGLALADWAGYAARREASQRRGVLRGRGIATFLEWTGGNVFEEKVSVDVTADGSIEIFSATQAMGQGIATSYAQLAVDVFGVPIEKIRVVQGDTDRGNGFGSAGSRSLFTGGSAVREPPSAPVEHAKALAGEALEAGRSRHRVPRRPLRGRRHGRRHRSLRAGRQAARRPGSTSTRAPRSAGRPGRTPATSARSRSTPTPATCASSPTPRSTTSAG
jgi:CO/xanthine dehydrogenase Mo-binding subunit